METPTLESVILVPKIACTIFWILTFVSIIKGDMVCGDLRREYIGSILFFTFFFAALISVALCEVNHYYSTIWSAILFNLAILLIGLTLSFLMNNEIDACITCFIVTIIFIIYLISKYPGDF